MSRLLAFALALGALAPADALAIDIPGVVLPLRAAEDAYEDAWRSCFNMRDSYDTVIEGCDRAALARTFEDYRGRRERLCAMPLPRKDPFDGIGKRSFASDEFDALKVKEGEYRLWVEFCAWTDREAAMAPNLFTWNKDTGGLTAEVHDATNAEAVFRKLYRLDASDVAAWWWPYRAYADETYRLCRYLAKYGRRDGTGSFGDETWTKRCAAADLKVFAVDPAIFPPRKPGGSGGPSLADLIGDGASTTGGGGASGPPPRDPRPPADTVEPPPPTPRDVRLTVTLAGRDPGAISAIPVPGALELVVSGVDAATGDPARLVHVDVSVGEVPFARLDTGRKLAWDRLDDAGRYVAKVVTRAPRRYDDYLRLTELPLSMPLTVTLKDDDGRKLARASWTLPFNLALYHGVTVGPDMEARDVGGPPAIEIATGALARESYEDGAFAVLAWPMKNATLEKNPTLPTPVKSVTLVWPDELIMRLPAPKPAYGARIDVGLADALSATEHEARIFGAVRAFVGDMGLSASWKKRVLGDLAHVSFRYDPHAKNGDTAFGPAVGKGGTIIVPYTAEDYWHRIDLENIYALVLHELGHWIHGAVVERHPWIHIAHKALRVGAHNTWRVDTDSPAFKRPFVAWMEGVADVFAYAALAHWAARDEDIVKSPYFKRGYMEDFDDDDEAVAILETVRHGPWIEGLHTRFWVALYGREMRRRPARAFADVLATALQFSEDWDNWEGGVYAAPARTIDRWIWTKANYPSHLGVRITGDPFAIGSRYRLVPEGDPLPSLSVMGDTAEGAAVEVAGRRRELAKTPVVTVEAGQRVRVLEGPLVLDVSTLEERMMVRLKTGTVAVVRSAGLVAVLEGEASAVGPVKIVTPSALAQATGTVFRTSVAADGATEVAVLEGHVRVDGRAAGQHTLSAGQRVRAAAAGRLAEPGAYTLPARRPPEDPDAPAFVADDPAVTSLAAQPRDARALFLLILGGAAWLVAAVLVWRRRRAGV